jgi:hypothetical protein
MNMRPRLVFVVWLGLSCVVLAQPGFAAAHDVYLQAPPPPPSAPNVYVVNAPAVQPAMLVQPQAHAPIASDEGGSALRYGVAGFFAGGLAGLGVGYLATDGARGSGAWRGLLLASGVGALSVAGLGIGLGVIDAAAERRPRPARSIMRDAAYGTLLGAAFGATVGGLVALESRRGSDALLGASIGAISGIVVGALIGALEGRFRRRENVVLSVGALRDARGQQVFSPSVAGRF